MGIGENMKNFKNVSGHGSVSTARLAVCLILASVAQTFAPSISWAKVRVSSIKDSKTSRGQRAGKVTQAKAADAADAESPAPSGSCEAIIHKIDNAPTDDARLEALSDLNASCKEDAGYVDVVISLLSPNFSAGIRREAAVGLSERTDPRSVVALARTLKKDASADVRGVAASSLSPESKNRAVALQTLTDSLKQDASSEVRAQVATRLAGFRDNSSIITLIAALRSDDSVKVREAALRSLKSIGNPLGVEAMANAVKNDSHPEIQEAAAKVLAELGATVDKDSSATVRRYFSSNWKKLKRTQPQLVATLAFTLGRMRDAEAVSPLMDVLNDDWNGGDVKVRGSAIEALGTLGQGQAEKSLRAELKRPDGDIRAMAALALVGLKCEPAYSAGVDALLRESESSGRETLAQILSQPRFDKTTKRGETLCRLLQTYEGPVVALALESLERVGDRSTVDGLVTFIETSGANNGLHLERAFAALDEILKRAKYESNAVALQPIRERVVDAMRGLKGRNWKRYDIAIADSTRLANDLTGSPSHAPEVASESVTGPKGGELATTTDKAANVKLAPATDTITDSAAAPAALPAEPDDSSEATGDKSEVPAARNAKSAPANTANDPANAAPESLPE